MCSLVWFSRLYFWDWECSIVFPYNFRVIASSLYSISAYESFHRNTLLLGSSGNLYFLSFIYNIAEKRTPSKTFHNKWWFWGRNSSVFCITERMVILCLLSHDILSAVCAKTGAPRQRTHLTEKNWELHLWTTSRAQFRSPPWDQKEIMNDVLSRFVTDHVLWINFK